MAGRKSMTLLRGLYMPLPNAKNIHVLTGPTPSEKPIRLALGGGERRRDRFVRRATFLPRYGHRHGQTVRGGTCSGAASLDRYPRRDRNDGCHLLPVIGAGGVGRDPARGRRVLVTGGSGFYLKDSSRRWRTTSRSRRNALGDRAQFESEGLDSLLTELRALNPHGLGALDVANPRRVARALERCRTTGRTLIVLAAEFARDAAPFADWAWAARGSNANRPISTNGSRLVSTAMLGRWVGRRR